MALPIMAPRTANQQGPAAPRTANGAAEAFETLPGQEKRLRYRLRVNPNDGQAFTELVAVVYAHASPGSRRWRGFAPRARKCSLEDVIWALGEELARDSRAWRPLVELARLSLGTDPEAAMQRFDLACRRDPGGPSLAQCLAALREAGAAGHAVRLGLAHYRHDAGHASAAATQLLRAGVEAGRLNEVRHFLEAV